MFESLKAERKLSLNCWRYRLLHWCFNEKVEQVEDSSLPKWLYSHYCPLFHVTNLIAIFLPLIILVRLLVALVKGIGHGIKLFAEKVDDRLTKRLDARVNSDEYKLKKEKKRIVRCIKEDGWDFKNYWMRFCHRHELMSKEEVEVFYNKLLTKYDKVREAKKQKSEARNKKILFWVNFSSVFVKWLINGIYIGLLGLVVYLTWTFFDSIVECFRILFSMDSLWFVLGMLKWAGISLIISGVVILFGYLSVKSKIINSVFDKIRNNCKRAAPAGSLIVKVISAPFVWIGKGILCICDFVSTFYQEHCPPITIVSDEEAELEE